MADTQKARELADDLTAAWAEWRDPFYEGPWEHLGDAERDARVLVAGVTALAAALAEKERELAMANARIADLTQIWEQPGSHCEN